MSHRGQATMFLSLILTLCMLKISELETDFSRAQLCQDLTGPREALWTSLCWRAPFAWLQQETPLVLGLHFQRNDPVHLARSCTA